MPIEMQRREEQDRSIAGCFEMRRRLPDPALDGIVTDICGYRETAPGHFRNVEYASLTVPAGDQLRRAFRHRPWQGARRQ